MFKMTAQLIAQPTFNLKAFVPQLGQPTVNEVDSKNIQSASKFAELVDYLLSDTNVSYSHLTLTFAFDIPIPTLIELHNYGWFRVFADSEQLMSTGIMSGSFARVREFLKWSQDKDRSEFMQQFGRLIAQSVQHLSYFQTVSASCPPVKHG